ncbi:hypothetical protein PFDSM3638_02910 [Pyrococcus furiosus DSM 3638]|uniref:Uncharacterized protein n=3 Tax=Pyrococcus furiosus TaxID=2261 RepID=Q8U390_PYRFU|nr:MULTISPECIES: hypothetical protein [Pyrococcus]AAL80704.1 hypothetical protein PF0580 [Pyrococcus furiosus DSM 3638]AFN03373.1 hypothetical protein PFC_02030 [Pyrococcus furiosus COM1]MDK2870330.1 hypothetical protein [Pyrococcus sp.]QEK78286.1 hypothetical protein PFDSM3638_02910 [Pyrococcus furiosus DSM 3638]
MKRPLTLILLGLMLGLVFIVGVILPHESKHPYESLRPALAFPDVRTLEIVDDKSYTLNIIVFNKNNETLSWVISVNLPEKIKENARLFFVDNGFIVLKAFSIAPNATFIEVNWSSEMVWLEDDTLNFNLTIPPKSYVIIPVSVVFKEWPSYPLGKLLNANITKLDDSIYMVSYVAEEDCIVEIWVPKKIGYSKEYGIRVNEYKNKIEGIFEKIKSEYGILVVGKEVKKALEMFKSYEDVEAPTDYCLTQKAEGEEIYSKDWMSYLGASGYYTSGEYYITVFEGKKGSLLFTANGTCEPKVIIKSTLVKNTTLATLNIHPTESITIITQETVIG